MGAFGQKMKLEFMNMRVRTRVSICARLGMAVFLVIAGLVQILYSADGEKFKFQHLQSHFIAVED